VSDLQLSHFSGQPIEFDPDRTYIQPAPLSAHEKPKGFWVSVDGQYDWREWCLGESWNLDGFASRLPLTLAPTANVLLIETEQALIEFTHRYGVPAKYSGGSPAIAWPVVADEYDGIIISPYQWGCRYGELTSFYYGWDCASGCIWNLAALEVLVDA
jgi:hypothetical protein